MSKPTPITFDAPCFAIFDVDENAVRTTKWGNLAVFNTEIVAKQVAAQTPGNNKVVPVFIRPTEKQ